MGPRSATKRKALSPSPSESSSSEASSSRSAMQVEQATSASNSNPDQASDTDSGSESDEDAVTDAEQSVGSDSDDDEESLLSARPAIDAAKARTKLHHVAKTLRATAKKSKTFEVQKLVKKLKGLQKETSLADQAAAAEKELAALKSIDTALLAGRALVTKMVKAKLLPRPAELASADEEEYLYLKMVREEELLGEAVLSNPVAVEGDKALEKAKARITSSKVLADQVGRFVDELKKLAGIEPATSTKAQVDPDPKGKGKAKQQEEEGEREWSGSEDESDSDEDDDAPRRLPLVDDEDEGEEGDVDEEELMRIGSEKMKALGDLSQWDGMIGSDSDVESGSESEEEMPTTRKRKTRHESDESSDDDASGDDDDDDDDDSEASMSDEDEDDSSDSDSNSDSDSDSSTSRPHKRKSTTTTTSSKPSKKPKATSTFLPTLSTGFIAGRSDDEWSDAEADLADRDLSELKSGKKERKNRMGQRARKALYEKKYGSNANHIKMREKHKQAKLERASATNGKGGSGRQRPPAFQAPAKKDGGWGGPVAPLPKQPRVARVRAPPAASVPVPVQEAGGRNGVQKSAPTPKSQEMHPSWIAKQKQKELMAQVKPQGKKVVFD